MDVALALLFSVSSLTLAEPGPETTVPDVAAASETSPAESPQVPPSLPADPAPETQPEPEPPESEPEPAAEAPAAAPDVSPPPPAVEPVATDSPAARDDEPSPIAQRKPEVDDSREYQRKGGFLAFSGGLGQCGVSCSYLPVLGGARFEGGYRWGHLAIGASASLAGAKFSTTRSEEGDSYRTADESGRIQFFQVGPFAQLFLASAGRLDPYLQVGIGYQHFMRQSDITEGTTEFRWKYVASSPGVTLGGGVPMFVTERTTVGVRFDKNIQFSGKVCRTIDGDALEDQPECETRAELNQDLNAIDSRLSRLERPRPWTVAFEARFLF